MESQQLSAQFILLVWPLFVVNGLNVTLSVYLTAMQKPLQSMLVALTRGLILPAALLLLFVALLPDIQFLIALPLAEWLTFIFALVLCWKYSPSNIIEKKGNLNMKKPDVIATSGQSSSSIFRGRLLGELELPGHAQTNITSGFVVTTQDSLIIRNT